MALIWLVVRAGIALLFSLTLLVSLREYIQLGRATTQENWREQAKLIYTAAYKVCFLTMGIALAYRPEHLKMIWLFMGVNLFIASLMENLFTKSYRDQDRAME